MDNRHVIKTTKPLRYGYTTGACATATSLAAATLLLTDKNAPETFITLPRGQPVKFTIDDCHRLSQDSATASTIKDAGDDPDVTHGAVIRATVQLSNTAGIQFFAGPGIGTVTKAGLALAIGEPAINPVPRQMIDQHLQQLAQKNHYLKGFKVTIAIDHGQQLAQKTMNARLGIIGGLSILGTTGIVRPFSCSAYIASIHQSIDVAMANGANHLIGCTGNSSEQTIKQHHQLADFCYIEMGDFVGAVLKYLRKQPIPRLTLAGGFGKFCKLAAGHVSLHSHHSSIDFEFLRVQSAALNASPHLQAQILQANTSQHVLTLAQQENLPLGDHLAKLAKQHLTSKLHADTKLKIYLINKQNQIVGYAG